MGCVGALRVSSAGGLVGCTVEDLGKGVAKDWWQLFDLVAAWRFVPLDVWLGLGAQQPVKLCIDVQDGVLIIMRAG